jgi:hypothetical protein
LYCTACLVIPGGRSHFIHRHAQFIFWAMLMNVHTAQYINESQSTLRGIKNGWYAMNTDGLLAFGPFSNREACLSRMFQFSAWSKSSGLRHRPV